MKDDKAIVKAEPKAEVARVGGYNWTGLNPAQIKGVAQAMALSGMFPDIQKDSAKAFVKIMAGQEMGIPPFQAMNDISIIAGKASANGNLYAAKVKGNPKYDYRIKNWTNKGCAIEFFQIENGKKESLGMSQFDENDARTAGLLGKGNWKTYPRNMYFNRAMTAGVRTYCPDALGGVTAYTPEELGAEVDSEGNFLGVGESATPAKAIAAPAQSPEPPVEDDPGDDEVPVDNPPEEASVSDEEMDSLKDSLNEIETEDEFKIPDKPKYGPKTSSGLARPEQRKYLKQLFADNNIEPEEAGQIAQTIIKKNAPATYDDFEALIDFVRTGEIPGQTDLLGGEDEANA